MPLTIKPTIAEILKEFYTQNEVNIQTLVNERLSSDKRGYLAGIEGLFQTFQEHNKDAFPGGQSSDPEYVEKLRLLSVCLKNAPAMQSNNITPLEFMSEEIKTQLPLFREVTSSNGEELTADYSTATSYSKTAIDNSFLKTRLLESAGIMEFTTGEFLIYPTYQGDSEAVLAKKDSLKKNEDENVKGFISEGSTLRNNSKVTLGQIASFFLSLTYAIEEKVNSLYSGAQPKSEDELREVFSTLAAVYTQAICEISNAATDLQFAVNMLFSGISNHLSSNKTSADSPELIARYFENLRERLSVLIGPPIEGKDKPYGGFFTDQSPTAIVKMLTEKSDQHEKSFYASGAMYQIPQACFTNTANNEKTIFENFFTSNISFFLEMDEIKCDPALYEIAMLRLWNAFVSDARCPTFIKDNAVTLRAALPSYRLTLDNIVFSSRLHTVMTNEHVSGANADLAEAVEAVAIALSFPEVLDQVGISFEQNETFKAMVDWMRRGPSYVAKIRDYYSQNQAELESKANPENRVKMLRIVIPACLKAVGERIGAADRLFLNSSMKIILRFLPSEKLKNIMKEIQERFSSGNDQQNSNLKEFYLQKTKEVITEAINDFKILFPQSDVFDDFKDQFSEENSNRIIQSLIQVEVTSLSSFVSLEESKDALVYYAVAALSISTNTFINELLTKNPNSSFDDFGGIDSIEIQGFNKIIDGIFAKAIETVTATDVNIIELLVNASGYSLVINNDDIAPYETLAQKLLEKTTDTAISNIQSFLLYQVKAFKFDPNIKSAMVKILESALPVGVQLQCLRKIGILESGDQNIFGKLYRSTGIPVPNARTSKSQEFYEGLASFEDINLDDNDTKIEEKFSAFLEKTDLTNAYATFKSKGGSSNTLSSRNDTVNKIETKHSEDIQSETFSNRLKEVIRNDKASGANADFAKAVEAVAIFLSFPDALTEDEKSTLDAGFGSRDEAVPTISPSFESMVMEMSKHPKIVTKLHDFYEKEPNPPLVANRQNMLRIVLPACLSVVDDFTVVSRVFNNGKITKIEKLATASALIDIVKKIPAEIRHVEPKQDLKSVFSSRLIEMLQALLSDFRAIFPTPNDFNEISRQFEGKTRDLVIANVMSFETSFLANRFRGGKGEENINYIFVSRLGEVINNYLVQFAQEYKGDSFYEDLKAQIQRVIGDVDLQKQMDTIFATLANNAPYDLPPFNEILLLRNSIDPNYFTSKIGECLLQTAGRKDEKLLLDRIDRIFEENDDELFLDIIKSAIFSCESYQVKDLDFLLVNILEKLKSNPRSGFLFSKILDVAIREKRVGSSFYNSYAQLLLQAALDNDNIELNRLANQLPHQSAKSAEKKLIEALDNNLEIQNYINYFLLRRVDLLDDKVGGKNAIRTILNSSLPSYEQLRCLGAIGEGKSSQSGMHKFVRSKGVREFYQSLACFNGVTNDSNDINKKFKQFLTMNGLQYKSQDITDFQEGQRNVLIAQKKPHEDVLQNERWKKHLKQFDAFFENESTLMDEQPDLSGGFEESKERESNDLGAVDGSDDLNAAADNDTGRKTIEPTYDEKLIEALDDNKPLPEYFDEKKITQYLKKWLDSVSDVEQRDVIVSSTLITKLPKKIARSIGVVLERHVSLFEKLKAIGELAKAELDHAPWHRSSALQGLYQSLAKFSDVKDKVDVVKKFKEFSAFVTPNLKLEDMAHKAQHSILTAKGRTSNFVQMFKRWVRWSIATKEEFSALDLAVTSSVPTSNDIKKCFEFVNSLNVNINKKTFFDKLLNPFCSGHERKVPLTHALCCPTPNNITCTKNDLADLKKTLEKFETVIRTHFFGSHYLPTAMKQVIASIDNNENPEAVLSKLQTGAKESKDRFGRRTRRSETEAAYQVINDFFDKTGSADRKTIASLITLLDDVAPRALTSTAITNKM